MKKTFSAPVLWTAVVVAGLGALFANAGLPEYKWVSITLLAVFVAAIIGLLIHNKKALAGRTAAYGLYSGVTTLLVISLVGVFCFVTNRYPKKFDWTKNRVHSLSDQTKKLVRELKLPVKAVFYGSLGQREESRGLIDNLRGLNTKFEVEYVDPSREIGRMKQVGIKRVPTLQLLIGTRETKLEEINEEKITNALIKLSKEKPQTLCAIVGHGERPMSNKDQTEGAGAFKEALESQAYTVRDVNLLQDLEVAKEGKVPASCDAIAILGANRAYLPQEAKLIQDYLADGGRALIMIDFNLKGAEYVPEIVQVLAKWHLKPENALVVDPTSKLLNVDPIMPLVVDFSKDNPITKALVSAQMGVQVQCLFPVVRPLSLIPGAPPSMNVQWLAKSTPNAWGETDIKSLGAGRVTKDANDIALPMILAAAVEGKLKDSKAVRNTRIAAFGTSTIATNQGVRLGFNLDLVMNAASWVLEDESLISIRTKDEDKGKIELTEKAGSVIKLLTVIVMPLLILIAGIVIWVRRRKL